MRRATTKHKFQHQSCHISIHALLAESDPHCHQQTAYFFYFYPRSPCGERRDVIAVMTDAQSISIHALLAESDCPLMFWLFRHCRFLSTLSLRRATVKLFRQNYECFISIHALLAESDDARRALGFVDPDISIHALLAESDYLGAGKSRNVCDFYPRSPCGERLLGGLWVLLTLIFLSTLSLRRATRRK